MKKYMSTGYAWFEGAEVKTQLHIYTLDTTDEWDNTIEALASQQATQEFLFKLGYNSNPIFVEPIAGATYAYYDMHLMGNFLIIEETVALDI